MKSNTARLILIVTMSISSAYAQKISLNKENLTPHLSQLTFDDQYGKNAIRVVKSPQVIKVDEPTYVKINNLNFGNGTVELEVMGRLLPNAPDSARAFIGLAFHINSDDSKFECIYLRPTNAVSSNQIRRNRSVQYFSYPDFKFNHSRKTNLGEFETYADIAPNEWIKMKIVVKGENATLYINGNKNPSLIVNKMKMGADQTGGLGLWVDIGTEGYFRNLVVIKDR
ncbi:hypothetical protein EZ456_13080 [Pedobacter psychrodurus]|uniref:3-keto-alpha-glucoside-1,2-lyase/3-keto-2-hydroxy-glucal hydratase domain-containing protein n=1 Tax=Pedobacter psychrodurus TaxID=2530456 RepID=A0A4R0PYL0_9SPHI|nr:family 16 glycoside hydrolase [Pedobacter psychrodurus]TCD26521.1 hypothetical protein EZ456_13080 [Pedobacter psychrodurus]